MKLFIADTDQLLEYVSISGDILYSSIKPYIRPAEQIMERYIGPALLEEIRLAAFDEAAAATDVQNTLIDLIRMPIANLAVLGYVGVKNVQVSDIGVSRAKTDSYGDAFEWQYEGLRRELTKNAHDGIEALLRYLEQNIEEVPAYTESEAYQLDKNLLIRSAAAFSRFYFIDASRLVFHTLLPSLRMAQDRRVWPALGNELLFALIDADIAGVLSPVQAKQLRFAQQALTYLTIARALRERLIQIGDQGLSVTGISTLAYKKPPDEKALQRSIDYFVGEADAALSDLAASLPPPAPSVIRLSTHGPQGDRIVSF